MSRQPQSTGTRLTGEEARARLIAGLPVTEHRLDLSGISAAVLDGGEGDPVVFLHGQGEFAAVWAAVLPALGGNPPRRGP